MRNCIERSRIATEDDPSGGMAKVFTFRFSSSEPVFKGHFPQKPIVPGVFQIEMARLGAEWISGRSLNIAEVRKAKFSRPLLPDEDIRMILKLHEENGYIHAEAVLSVENARAGQVHLILN